MHPELVNLVDNKYIPAAIMGYVTRIIVSNMDKR